MAEGDHQSGPPRTAGVGPSKYSTGPDPALRAISRWTEARRRYAVHRLDVVARLAGVPEWLRRWPGVFLGCETDESGEPVVIHARDEETLEAFFARRAAAGPGRHEARRLARRREMALAELRLALVARLGALAAVGLDPRDADRWIYESDADRQLAAAEAEIETTTPRTVEGLLAKLRHVAHCLAAAPDDPDDARRRRDHATRVLRTLAEDARLLRAAEDDGPARKR